MNQDRFLVPRSVCSVPDNPASVELPCVMALGVGNTSMMVCGPDEVLSAEGIGSLLVHLKGGIWKLPDFALM